VRITDNNLSGVYGLTPGLVEIFGGWDGSQFTRKHYLHDIEKEVYTRLPDMPTGRNWGTVFLYESKIYVIGGYTSRKATTVNEVYDRDTETWTMKSSLPKARWGATREHPLIDNKCYITHGQYHRGTFPLTNFEYDSELDVWQNRAAPTNGRDGVANSVYNNRLYVVGGRSNHSGLQFNEVYDPIINNWTNKAAMPLGRADCTAVVINGKIYVFGGYDGSNVFANTQVYDPEHDSWTIEDNMPTARWGLSAVVDKNKAYVFGGQLASGVMSKKLEIFDPSQPNGHKWCSGADMPYGAQGLMVQYVK
jgi:N-acetylneuraminic acid mutarotase